MKVDCSKCEHCHYVGETCFFEFERASGASGQAVDNIYDVYWCRDFSEAIGEEEEEEKPN